MGARLKAGSPQSNDRQKPELLSSFRLVFRINFVLSQFIVNSELVEQSRGIGLAE
jgi:hypothetical protein